MDASQIIREIESLPSAERVKVEEHLRSRMEMAAHEEATRIALERLDIFDSGSGKSVSAKEAFRILGDS